MAGFPRSSFAQGGSAVASGIFGILHLARYAQAQANVVLWFRTQRQRQNHNNTRSNNRQTKLQLS